MTATLNKQQIWDNACAAYIPAADDHKDNIPFYRRWRGCKAVLEALGYSDNDISNLNYILHNAICMSEDYKGFVLSMHHFAPEMPKKPNLRIEYRCEPSQVTEADARRIFAEQFKAAYSGKRINSKFANAQWEKVKAKAMELAVAEVTAKLADFMKYEGEINDFNTRLMMEYDEKAARVQAVLDLVVKLEE